MTVKMFLFTVKLIQIWFYTCNKKKKNMMYE